MPSKELVGPLLRSLAVVAAVLAGSTVSGAAAQTNAAPLGLSSESPPMERDIYFDAQQTTYDKNTQVQHFSGEVVAITANLLIAADTINVDREKQLLQAAGHVVVAGREQLITGEQVDLNLKTREFAIKAATVLNQAPQEVHESTDRILGFSPEEAQFQQSQQQQLATVGHEKARLKREYYRRWRALEPKDLLVEQFALLLQQEAHLGRQSYFDHRWISPQQQRMLRERRAFWQKHQQPLSSASSAVGYFRLEGEEIRRDENQHFQASQGLFTPCLCGEGGAAPAWGFRASSIDAQLGGYAELYNPALEIKGVPVFYFPYLKFPLKNRRQTGLLFPDISYHSRDGNILTAPLFVALDPSRDATITPTFIERRGWRLGLEYRQQLRDYSGWQVNGEGIRDQSWLNSQAAYEYYAARYAEAHASADNLNEVLTYLRPPPNPWRGKASWAGLSIIDAKTSVVSEGSMASDHRYNNDFWYQYFVNTPSPLLPAFNKAGVMLEHHHDAYYLGLSSLLVDHTLSNTSYAGLQALENLRAQSRFVPLGFGSLQLPLYAQFSAEHHYFHLHEEPILGRSPTKDFYQLGLGDAQWFGGKIKSYAPLNSQQAVQVSFFSEFDWRLIKSQVAPRLASFPAAEAFEQGLVFSGDSSMHSLRSGLQFHLPLRGYHLSAPRAAAAAPEAGFALRSYEHLMDWDIILSLRPYAQRRGPYGEQYQVSTFNQDLGAWRPLQSSEQLTYFSSDNSSLSNSLVIPEEAVLTPHQKIIFKTFHQWFIKDQELKIQGGSTAAHGPAVEQATKEGDADNWSERARHELAQSLAEISGRHQREEDFLATASATEVLKNVQLLGQQRPLTWGSDINYDYQKELNRRALRRLSPLELGATLLPEPWSPWRNHIGLAWLGWSLGFSNEYNIYKKLATQATFTLSTPMVLFLSPSVLYKIEKEFLRDADGGFSYFPRYTREFAVSSSLLSALPLTARYGETSHYISLSETAREYMVGIGATYYSSSRCWGLAASWEKSYRDISWDGTYYLGLVINFFNSNRNFGNLVSRYNNPQS